MRTLFSIVAVALFCCPVARSQTPSSDAKSLQVILEEVRQLRQDIHSTAATVQRAQILIYRLRIQMDVVAVVTQRLEQTRGQLEQIKIQRTQLNEQIKIHQDTLDRTQDPKIRERSEIAIEGTKRWLEQVTEGEPEAQAKEMEYASQLRIEQAKLDDLQAQLDRLDKRLEIAATKAGGG